MKKKQRSCDGQRVHSALFCVFINPLGQVRAAHEYARAAKTHEGYCSTENYTFCHFFPRGICTLLRCLYSRCTFSHPVSLPYHLRLFFLQWAFCNCHGTCWHRLIYHSCRLGEPKTLPPEGNATIVRAICVHISFKHKAEVYVLCTYVHEKKKQSI